MCVHDCFCEPTASTLSTQPSSSSSSTKPAGVKREAETETAADSVSAPPAKRSKDDTPNTITAQEVRKYLQRRPMMPKELVKKFGKLKTGMDKQKVVAELGQLLKRMSDVDRCEIRGKMHLSLRPATTGDTS